MKTLITIIILISAFRLLSQDNQRIDLNNKEPNDEIRQVISRMMDAKQNGRVDELIRLQKQMDNLTGQSVTTELIPEKTVIQEMPLNIGDASVNISQVTNQTGIRAIGTVTEQLAPTAGRIWAVYAHSNGAQDVISLYSSINDGASWNSFTQVNLGTGNRVSADQMDIELLEGPSDKYLWIVYGYISNSSSWMIGLTIVKITGSSSVQNYTLNWLGVGGDGYFYKPRICSDNAAHLNSPFVYIICNYDTADTGGYYCGGKVAQCLNPFATTPYMTYKTGSYAGMGIYTRPYNYDISYYKKNGWDSVAVVELGISDSQTVYCYNSHTSFFTSASNFASAIISNSRGKTDAYIAGNGAYDRLMVVCRERYSPNLWDIRYFKSSSGAYGWTNGYLDARYVNKSRPEIIGKRNSPGTFYCAYSTIGTYDSVFYSKAASYNWSSPVGPVNSFSSSVTNAQPRPGFKNLSIDDCLTLWAPSSGGGVYASYGCGPIVIGINQNGTEIPLSFELKQNYPNPFNPVTNIEFSIPKPGFVKLIVYDILGKEITNLVNENLKAGIYKIDWDASANPSGIYFYTISAESFSETKKMVLIK